MGIKFIKMRNYALFQGGGYNDLTNLYDMHSFARLFNAGKCFSGEQCRPRAFCLLIQSDPLE